MRARWRSIAFDHFGTFHSSSISGMKPVLGSTILIDVPVALRKPRSTLPAFAVTHWRANGPPPVSEAMNVSLRSSYMRAELTHVYLSAKSRACGLGSVTLFHGWRSSTGLPERVLGHERRSLPCQSSW